MKKEKKVAEAPQVPITPEFIPFNKASLEEKVNRCHFVIRDLITAMNKVQKDQTKLETNFFGHKHVDNALMQMISQFGADKEEKDTRPEDEKWF